MLLFCGVFVGPSLNFDVGSLDLVFVGGVHIEGLVVWKRLLVVVKYDSNDK